jgi:hypothetical protein
MRSLSASSKGKAAGEGEGARTGALPFPSRGRLARVATLAMAGWSRLAGFGGLLGEKAGVSRKKGRLTVKHCLFGASEIRKAQNRPKVGRGKTDRGERQGQYASRRVEIDRDREIDIRDKIR